MIPIETSTIYGLTLREALRKWAGGQLRLFLRTQDAAVKQARIHVYYEKCIDEPDDEFRTNAKAKASLKLVELEAVQDLKYQLEEGRLHIMGIPTKPVAGTTPIQILGRWATDLEMDLDTNTIQFHENRYVYIRVFPGSNPAPLPDVAGASEPTSGGPQEPSQVAALSDEVILEMLEEHARRVIASPDARLIVPGKISFLPIIRRKMIARGEERTLLLTKDAECVYLAEWIKSKIKHHQLPTSKTIAKVLAMDYLRAKARSTRAIEKHPD